LLGRIPGRATTFAAISLLSVRVSADFIDAARSDHTGSAIEFVSPGDATGRGGGRRRRPDAGVGPRVHVEAGGWIGGIDELQSFALNVPLSANRQAATGGAWTGAVEIDLVPRNWLGTLRERSAR
jgi:hypothetical protein